MGIRVVLNTTGFVYPVLCQFFFLLGMNAIFAMGGVYRKATFSDHVRYRLPIVSIWTLFTALSTTSWAVFYDETYSIKAKNFFALWAVAWYDP
ncbi:hypothetical protein RQP46_006153 [Phenoliferia psychrophenolica]